MIPMHAATRRFVSTLLTCGLSLTACGMPSDGLGDTEDDVRRRKDAAADVADASGQDSAIADAGALPDGSPGTDASTGGTDAAHDSGPVTDAARDSGTSSGRPYTLIGMSTPRSEWDARLAQVGRVDARRIFDDLATSSSAITLARSEIAAGRYPILSFKLPGNDWAGAAAGTYDTQLRALATSLAALPGRLFVTIHHEPSGDGTPAGYAAMQRHVLPILSPAANVDAGVIVNGFWWSAQAQGYTDTEIAQWLPADVLRLAEVIAADTYQGGTTASPGEDAGVKIRRMSQWASRVGVTRLGIGEFNGLTAAAITSAGDAVLADHRFVFASCFNSSQNNAPGVDWTLTGDRLTAFQQIVVRAHADLMP